jgi:hypothetical protein
MRRVLVYVEGRTESSGLQGWLAQEVQMAAQLGCSLHFVLPMRKGNAARDRFRRIKGKQALMRSIRELVWSDIRSTDHAVLGLVDLLGQDDRGNTTSDPANLLADLRARAAGFPRQHLFFPHVAVWETETWILADIDALGRAIPAIANAVPPADEVPVREHPYPEAIDGEDTPFARLRRILTARLAGAGQPVPASEKYYKGLVARILPHVDKAAVSATCPHFAAFYQDLRRACGI